MRSQVAAVLPVRAKSKKTLTKNINKITGTHQVTNMSMYPSHHQSERILTILHRILLVLLAGLILCLPGAFRQGYVDFLQKEHSAREHLKNRQSGTVNQPPAHYRNGRNGHAERAIE